MSTSANVTYYSIYKDGNLIKEHRQNCLCKNYIDAELKNYPNPAELILVLRWPDEDEVNHFTVPMSLKDYLDNKSVEWKRIE